jgi:hypothetical protein
MQVQRVKSIVDRMKVCAAGIEKSLGSQVGDERSQIEAC